MLATVIRYRVALSMILQMHVGLLIALSADIATDSDVGRLVAQLAGVSMIISAIAQFPDEDEQ